jgi:hypothetical protein
VVIAVVMAVNTARGNLKTVQDHLKTSIQWPANRQCLI